MNNKGVSAVFVTILLIAIAIVASILAYGWSMGLIGELEGSGGEQTKHQLNVMAYQAESDSQWNLRLKNVGHTTLTIAAIYVQGTPVSFNGDTTYNPGETGSLTIDVNKINLFNGVEYVVKITTPDGAIIPFPIRYGHSE